MTGGVSSLWTLAHRNRVHHRTGVTTGPDPSAPPTSLGTPALRALVPLSVWHELAPLVDDHFTPIMLLSMSMRPQPMLTDATGRERTVFEALEAGDYEPVLAMFRWLAIPPDADAPRIADRER